MYIVWEKKKHSECIVIVEDNFKDVVLYKVIKEM